MVILNDGVQSFYTALSKKSSSLKYASKIIMDNELLDAYNNSWIVKKYIDKTVQDMTKKKRTFNGNYDEKVLDVIELAEKRTQANKAISDALTWSALLGECLVVAVTDNNDMESWLDDDESISKFICLAKGEYSIDSDIDKDLNSQNFGKPLFFTYNKQRIHHSRCCYIKLGKSKITDREASGVSDLQSCFDDVLLFDTIITCIADLIQDSNVDVLFIPDLLERIANGQENKIRDYMTLIQSSKSSSNMIVLDAGSSEAQGRWEQKTANYSGLSEVLSKMINVLAGALDRPITVLFGQSASGFASGEEDNRAYYETVNALQESRLRKIHDFIDKFILNKIISEDNISFSYPPIDSLNDSEQADLFTKISTALTQLVTAEIISDEVAQNELLARNLLINTTREELDEMNIYEKEEDKTDHVF